MVLTSRIGMLLVAITLVAVHAEAGVPAEVESYLTPEDEARLEDGKAVLVKGRFEGEAEDTRGKGCVLMMIAAPREEVWGYLVRSEDHPEFMPHVVGIDVYLRKGKTVRLKQTLRFPFKTVSYHVIEEHDEDACTLTWQIDKKMPNDISDTSGSWVLVADGENKTIAVYTVRADMGMGLGRALRDLLMNYDLPGVVEALKKRVESGGTYKKPIPGRPGGAGPPMAGTGAGQPR